MSRTNVLVTSVLLSTSALTAVRAGEVETIIVQGLRIPQTAGESGTSVTVITDKDIERRQFTQVIEALRLAPGVTIDRSGTAGGTASVRIRGADSDQTLVLIDGINVNDPTSTGGGFDFAFLDTADIERIEVLRGAQSTLWGADAIGGVINILTKRPEQGLSASGFVEGGSFGTWRGGASVSGGYETLDFRLAGSGLTSDGISKADEDDGNTEDDGIDQLSLSGRLGVQLTENFRIDALGGYSDSEFDIDGFPPPSFAFADTLETSSSTDTRAALVASLDLWDGRFRSELSASYYEIERVTGGSGFTGYRDTYRYEGTADLASWLTTAFGVERETTEYANEDRDRDSAFALVEIKPVDRLTISGGLRWDDDSAFGGETTARVSGAFAAADWLTLHASYGEGYKAPSLYQTFGDGGVFVLPNPDLRPEMSEGYDVGVTLGFDGGAGEIDVTYFDAESTDLIDYDFGVPGYVNVAKAGREGVEVAASWLPIEALALRVSYAYLEARDGTTGQRILRVPQHTADADATWYMTPDLSATIAVLYRSEEVSTSFDPIVDEWVRVDLAGTWTVSQGVDLYGRIENLLDEDYQEVSTYGTPGLSGFIGTRVRL
ncbi:MAG: TonB-dependent receptor [Alphaproteobacteria bacterium]|nr:TonB-dependent receptor [Alphaproteobacteria bacterium]